ncbi:MAG TPA: phage/plasmid primase, P4 family [Polyangiaceae bacterium]|nr:phage/plasmid primase, P4 family [Polyangiaceae bacterium]
MSTSNSTNATPAPGKGPGKLVAAKGSASDRKPRTRKRVEAKQLTDQREEYIYDEIGNGERLAVQCKDVLRYVPALKKWFVWWKEGVWSEQHPDEVDRLAKRCARSILDDPHDGDHDLAKKIANWAKFSASVRGRSSMTATASSDTRLVAQVEEFDSNPWLLNVQNGTIDLQTGRLRPHEAGDLITKQIPVAYKPDAKFRAWEKFLAEKVPNEGLRDYLQRALGYTLSGDVSEEKMFFIYGDTSSGKSTLLEAVQAVLGPYATTSTFKMLLENKNEGVIQPDLSRHVASRMVIAQEVKDDVAFDKASIKCMVSCNSMVAKRLYSDPFEFVPRWKLWVAANTRPRVDAGDSAMWRRIRVLPFTQSITEDQQNPKLRTLLASDERAQQAILAWMVKGCLMWQGGRGLSEPPIVREASRSYREANDSANDSFEDFFESTYVFNPDGFVPTADIHQAYATYCLNGFVGSKLDRGELLSKLRLKGLKDKQRGTKRVRGLRGITPRKA